MKNSCNRSIFNLVCRAEIFSCNQPLTELFFTVNDSYILFTIRRQILAYLCGLDDLGSVESALGSPEATSVSFKEFCPSPFWKPSCVGRRRPFDDLWRCAKLFLKTAAVLGRRSGSTGGDGQGKDLWTRATRRREEAEEGGEDEVGRGGGTGESEDEGLFEAECGSLGKNICLHK